MTHTLYQVDAFTDRPFKGNPAAVCLLQKPLKQLFFSLKMEIGICAGSRRRLRWTCVDTRRWQAHE